MINPTQIKGNVQKCKGSAIIVALLIMTLVTTLAITMMVQQQAQIERTTLVLNNDRMYLDAKVVEAWARGLLIQDAQTAHEQAQESGSQDVSKTAMDNLPRSFSDITATNGFQVSGTLIDMQGKFNLNNLVNEQYEANFANMIQVVDPDIDPKDAKAIAVSVHEWVTKPQSDDASNTSNVSTNTSNSSNTSNVSTNTNNSSNTSNVSTNTSNSSNTTNTSTNTSTADQAASADAKINRYYGKLHPPYRAAQALMVSPSELRLVKGMNANLYMRLKPFITALPKQTPININTASAPVIASLSKTLDLQTAIEIVQNRGDTPFSSIDDFLKDETIQNANINKADLTMNSDYFLVTAHVSNSSEKLNLHAMLYRPDADTNEDASTDQVSQTTQSSIAASEDQSQQKPIVVTVLWESRGGV
ncbi:MAG: general secretion pathway protein GspK [Gammaproteobacteria bacterium]|nr:general secretion pathway protein GspK [Gammaproteobacteria bacterium]